MRFYLTDAYIQALLSGIPKARKRVIIHATDIRWGEHLNVFLPLLADAAKRGLEVRIIGDMYSKYLSLAPHLNRSSSISWKATSAINDTLRQNGVQVSYIGKLHLNPFKRRTHSKITLLDDRIFTFGGINFSEGALQNKDYMLEMHDPILADRLYRLVRTIESNDPVPLPDLEEQLGGEATLLFDGGTPKQSIIYDTACRLAATAKKIYVVSQMCPSGQLAKNINKTDNECYFIRFNQTDPPDNLGLIFDQKRYHIKNRYTGNAYIHAKFLLTEDHNGTKHLLSGSNNLSYRGVAFGTREIALHSTNIELWNSFYQFIQQEIRGAAPQPHRT